LSVPVSPFSQGNVSVSRSHVHEQEASIIAQAGRKAAVTIATNMAGRGTDIILGGNPPDAEAVFVGGSTTYKLGADAAASVAAAKGAGLWAHMGRVNSDKRFRYAASIGCDSVDGTKYARFKRAWLRDGIHAAAAPPQLRLEGTPA
jgi:hypothetical protein